MTHKGRAVPQYIHDNSRNLWSARKLCIRVWGGTQGRAVSQHIRNESVEPKGSLRLPGTVCVAFRALAQLEVR